MRVTLHKGKPRLGMLGLGRPRQQCRPQQASLSLSRGQAAAASPALAGALFAVGLDAGPLLSARSSRAS